MQTEITLRDLPLCEDLVRFARRRAERLGAATRAEVRVTLAGQRRRKGLGRVVASVEVAQAAGPELVFTGIGTDPYAALERALRHAGSQPRPQEAA